MSARDSSSARRTASRGKRQEEPQKGKPFKPSTSISAMSEEAPGTNSESISKSPSDIFKDGAGTEKGSFKPDDYWDRVASKYASTFEGKVTESVSQLLVAYSQIQWRWLPQILDLGCGSGYLTQPLLKIPYSRVISTDLSNEFNNTALAEGESATIRNHSFSKMETNKLTFAVTHTYDAVFCNMRLHWFERPQKVMSEIIRVAKPGAEVLISTWDHRAYNWFLEVITEVIGDAAKSTFFPYQEGGSLSTKESIRSFLQDCGFVETRIATREVTLTMTPEEFSECVFNQISPIMAYREIEVDQKAKADVCNRIIQSIPRMSLQDIPASQGVPSKQRVIIPCYIMMIRAIVPITKEMKESLRSLTLNL